MRDSEPKRVVDGVAGKDTESRLLWRGSSPFDAELLASRLRSLGIGAYVDGAMLNDEFATSQRLMNNVGVKVFVTSDQWDGARAELEAFQSERGQVDPEVLAEEALAAEKPEVAARSGRSDALDPESRMGWFSDSLRKRLLIGWILLGALGVVGAALRSF